MSADINKAAIDIGIITRDAAAMLRFYRDLLGLPLESVMPMPSGGIMHRLKVGDSVVKIVQLDKAPPADGVPGGIPAATGFRYFTIHVKNLGEVVAVCEAAGLKVAVPPKTIRPSVNIAMICDPDGNWVELLQQGLL